MARNAEMEAGVQGSMSPVPQFHTMQQVTPHPYMPTSTLDNVMPNQNGMGTADFDRRRLGVSTSMNGQSEGTFDKSLWIRSAQPTARFDQTFQQSY